MRSPLVLSIVVVAIAVALNRIFPWVEHLVEAPPANVSALSVADIDQGGFAKFTRSRITGITKNVLTWKPARRDELVEFTSNAFADILVVGDSYADDIDMGFSCWPTLLAQRLKLPMVNAARGGSVAHDAQQQLARAHALAKPKGPLSNPEHVLLVVHTGGNDLIHAFFDPRLCLSFLSDVMKLTTHNLGLSNEPPSLMFATALAERITKELDLLLSNASSLGYRTALVSSLPLGPAIPLARALIRIAAPHESTRFVSETISAMVKVVNQSLRAAVRVASTTYSMKLFYFDEGTHLNMLASQAQADTFGLLEIPSLFAQKLVPSFRVSEFWKDGHHPSASLHRLLEQHAFDLISHALGKVTTTS